MLERNYKLASSAEKGDRGMGVIEYYKGIKAVLNDYHSIRRNTDAVIVIRDNQVKLYLKKRK